MGCAAALATIDVLHDEGLLDNATCRGTELRDGLGNLKQRHAAVGDVRGVGLMNAIEIIDADGRPDAVTTAQIREHCVEVGKLLLVSCGPDSNVIRLMPPLVVESEQIQVAVAAIDGALTALSQP
jgi:4-aminobutyrate aminotransferase